MSDQPPFSPNDPGFGAPPSAGPERKDLPTAEPRKAILHAAIACLEYAKQYLDKFTYWPDYILATHYQANILALTSKQENWDDAENHFKDVVFWLEPGEQRSAEEEARRRIRMEAMYNRAVLLERRGLTNEARTQFEALRTLINGNQDRTPKGVRLATEFALLMLTAKEFRFGATDQIPGVERLDEDKTLFALRTD
jgi:hypothetical protein